MAIENQEIVTEMKKLGMVFTSPSKNPSAKNIGGTRTVRLKKIPDPSGRDIYLHLDRESNEIYNEICFLLSKERHAEHNSPRDIERAIIEFIGEIIIHPERFRDLKQLNLQIQQTLSTLLRKFEPWWVIAPVEGLQIDFGKISIGDHFIKKFEVMDISTYFPHLESDSEKDVRENFVCKFCTFVTVQSNNPKSAKVKGEEKVNEILHILRSFFGTHFFTRIATPRVFASVNKVSMKGYFSQEFKHKEVCHIESRYQQSISNYLELVTPFVSANTNAAIGRKIVSAFRWLGMAVQDELPEDKIVKYCTALETVLVPDTEGLKGELLAFRVALLENRLGHNESGTHPNRILEYYKKRSEIIHGGDDEDDTPIEKFAFDVEQFTYRTLINVLRAIQRNNIQSKKQFRNWIEQADERTREIEDLFLVEGYDVSLQKYVQRRRTQDRAS